MGALGEMKDLMGDKFGVLVEKYLLNTTDYVSQLETAVANEEAKIVAGSAHFMKSSSASLGLLKMTELEFSEVLVVQIRALTYIKWSQRSVSSKFDDSDALKPKFWRGRLVPSKTP